jgi:hypothetical protein
MVLSLRVTLLLQYGYRMVTITPYGSWVLLFDIHKLSIIGLPSFPDD